MRAFSQLLDDLVYTRSRNTKLKQRAVAKEKGRQTLVRRPFRPL
jgi:hypothetical protein